MASKSQLLALTGMRCFLAFWVVVYHQFPREGGIEIPWLSFAPAAVHCILRTGPIAVTVFFVLSGFVLAYNYDLAAPWMRRQREKFWIARFSRIYPAYFLGLLIMVPFAVYNVARESSLQALGKQAWLAALNFTLLQSWIPSASQTWNYPGWSLSDEAFFYACFPLIGVLLWRLSRPRDLAIGGVLLWALSLAVPLWAVWKPIAGFGDMPAVARIPQQWSGSTEFWANLIRYDPAIRLPEFCSGVLLARAYELVRQRRPAWLGKGYWLYVPGLLGCAAVLSWADVIPLPLVHNGLLLPLYICTLFGLALGGGPLAALLSTSPLVFLGNASYSIYILHAPIAFWMSALWRHVFHLQPDGIPYVLPYCAVVLAISVLVYTKYEEPLNRVLKRRMGSRLVPPGAAAATVAAVERG